MNLIRHLDCIKRCDVPLSHLASEDVSSAKAHGRPPPLSHLAEHHAKVGDGVLDRALQLFEVSTGVLATCLGEEAARKSLVDIIVHCRELPPVRATKSLRMSLVPSKILNILRSLMTFSSPVSRMYPIPPKIWMASSVTNQAFSEAKIFEMAASSWNV